MKISMQALAVMAGLLVTSCGSSSSGSSSSGGTSSSGSSGSTSGNASSTSSTSSTSSSSTSSGGDAAPTGGTSLDGDLGALGAVKPTVSSLWISNSGETLVYMSSGTITCDMLKTSRWLGSAPAGAQVIEIVIKGAPKASTYPVPPGEVNYAAGGKSSSYEVNATSGTIKFTTADAMTVAGTVEAKYASGAHVAGTFEATFCDGGQGY